MKYLSVLLFALILILRCNSEYRSKEEIQLVFNPYYQINDSILITSLTNYVKEINMKYPNTTDEYRFWEFFILHATSHYSKILVKRSNNELLSTATGYFTFGRDVFILHTGLEIIADKDTTFVYNLVKNNTKEKYKLIHDFKIPEKDTIQNREFVRCADTILINY